MEIYIFILIILVFAILVGSTLGFGDALIFIALVAIFLDVRIAIVLASFWSIFLSILNAIKYRDFFDKSYFKKYIGPGILGVILGSFLLVIAPVRWLGLSLGIFILIYVIAKFNEIRKEKSSKGEETEQLNLSDNNTKQISDGLFYSAVFSYGFLSGLIGASGPINVALLERTGHERESLIENFSMTSIVVSSFKLGIYLWNGLFPIEFLVVYLLGFVVIYVVTKIGHWLTPRIPKEKFQVFILLLLTIIGIRLIIIPLFFY